MNNINNYYSLTEIASLLGMHVTTITRMEKSGLFPKRTEYPYASKEVFWLKSDVEKVIKDLLFIRKKRR